METREQLEKELQGVKDRIEILNMIEELLLKMKSLAEDVVESDLNAEEIEKINREVKYLQEQVMLLDARSTELSWLIKLS